LALWRIALGASCVQLVLRRWGGLDAFYAESGAYPVAALRSLTWEAGPLRWVTSAVALHLVFASCLLVAVAFTLGFGTRFVKWLLLPALFALNSRTPPLFTGGEVVLHGQALYALFLPIAQVLSVDSWRSSRLRAALPPNAAPTAISSPLYFVLLLQLSVIYFFNQRAKTGLTWQDGSAVAKALAAPSVVSELGVWVAHLPGVVVRGLSHGTLVVEGVLPFLLLSPWARKWTHALAGALMLALHGGIYCTLEVGSFSLAMLSYLPLLWHPGGEEERILVRSQRARRWEVAAAASLLYVGAARLSYDLILWPERPQLPLPSLLKQTTQALGLRQPWMMFSPDPPERDYVVVTDAVTQSGKHFDPWQHGASGNAQPLKELPQSLGRTPLFNNYEIYLSRGTNLQPFFARWVLGQRSPDGSPVDHFDAWLMIISTDVQRVVKVDELDSVVGVAPLPLRDSLAIKGFAASGLWAPERAFDGNIVPEETNVLTPVSAVMSAGCPHLTLDLGEPQRLESAFLQADCADLFWIEGSLDNQNFQPLAQMPRLPGRQHRSRVIGLPGELSRYIRIRPVASRASRHFLSEVALFDHPVSLPPLTSRPSEYFYSALARPAVTSLVSGSNHPRPDCAAEASGGRAAQVQ
jgi:hypothetical protein